MQHGSKRDEWDAPRYFHLHLGAYTLVTGALIVVDLVAFEGWRFFWPILIWGILVFLHFIYVKSTHVDKNWAEARTSEVRLKAYDLGHIESIEERYDGGSAKEGDADTGDGRSSPKDVS